MVNLVEVKEKGEMAEVRDIFIEYREDLGIELSFQDFQEELDSLPGEYSPPDGTIILAREKKKTVGCVALRRLDEQNCEMKRLYVKPEYRNQGIGRGLAEAVI